MGKTILRVVYGCCLTIVSLSLVELPAAWAIPAVAPGAAVPGGQHDADLYNLAGQAGLPKYFKCNQQCLAGADGIRGGEARTLDTDYLDKDFTLDVVFQFKGDDDRGNGFVGIGEHGQDAATTIAARLEGPKSGGMATIDSNGQWRPSRGKKPEPYDIGKFVTPGPHLLRLEKKENTLTFYHCAQYKGIFRADFQKGLPDIATTATGLNRLNSGLFFGGDVTFTSVRLEVDGKLLDPGPPASSLAKDIDVNGSEHFVTFAAGKPLPDWLVLPANAAISPDGLNLNDVTVRTKDFTFDLVYHFKPQEQTNLIVGVGENGHDSGNWVLNSIAASVQGPGYDGNAQFTFHSWALEMRPIGKVGRDHPGPNLFRIQIRGNTMTMSICVDFKDKFAPDFSTTIPGLSTQAPYLNDKNMAIFFYGGGTVDQVRLVVSGEPASKYEMAIPSIAAPGQHEAKTGLDAPVGKLFSLAGQAGLPTWLHASADASADAQGLRGGTLQSAAHDLATKNFTLDLLFKFDEGDKEFRAGIGEDAGQWGEAEKSVCARIGGPERNGECIIAIDNRKAQIPLGKIGKSAGPHLLRLCKTGDTFTIAICPDYKAGDPFNPMFVKTIPDLAAAASFLNSTNGQLFIAGDATWMAIALSVE